MSLFAKSRSGHWFEVPAESIPEGQPIHIGDTLRSPVDNEPATHLQFGGTLPESPPVVAADAGYIDTSEKPAPPETAVAESAGSSESVTP